jgi:hypothetical protein
MSEDDDFYDEGVESDFDDEAPVSKNVLSENKNVTNKKNKAVEETYQKLTPHEVRCLSLLSLWTVVNPADVPFLVDYSTAST